MMDLRTYLFQNKLKISDFAKMINYQREYINLICLGKTKPGKKLAEIIEKATNGEVTAKELLGNSNEKE